MASVYLAVLKMRKDLPPVKIDYVADNNMEAFNKMLSIMHLESSDAIYEYELLEVLDGPGYRIVASKNPEQHAIPFLPAPVSTAPPVVFEEETAPRHTYKYA